MSHLKCVVTSKSKRSSSRYARDLTFLLSRSATSRFPFLEDAGHCRLDASTSSLFAIIAFLPLAVPVSLWVFGVVSLDPISETFPVKKKRDERQYPRVNRSHLFMTVS